MKIKLSLPFLVICLGLTSYTNADTNNNSVTAKVILPDSTGRTLQVGTSFQIKDYKYDSSTNSFSLKTVNDTSLIARKYLLPKNSVINGLCVGGYGRVTTINNQPVKTTNPTSYDTNGLINIQLTNEVGFKTSCSEQMGAVKQIIVLNDIKLSDNMQIDTIPPFDTALKFTVSSGNYKILSIKTNQKQMQVTYAADPDMAPIFGTYNSNHEFSSLYFYQANRNEKTVTVIIDGIYKELLIPLGSPDVLQTITIN